MNSESKIVISEYDTVIDPNPHDGLLVGLFFPGDNRVLVAIRDLHGTHHCIELTGVISFRAGDLWEGNIILDITVNSGDEVESQFIACALGIEDNPAIKGNPNYEAYLLETMERFKKKELLLVQLNPSYGCEFTCVCSHISLAPAMVPLLNGLLTQVDS
jgi:hypothetical protein